MGDMLFGVPSFNVWASVTEVGIRHHRPVLVATYSYLPPLGSDGQRESRIIQLSVD